MPNFVGAKRLAKIRRRFLRNCDNRTLSCLVRIFFLDYKSVVQKDFPKKMFLFVQNVFFKIFVFCLAEKSCKSFRAVVVGVVSVHSFKFLVGKDFSPESGFFREKRKPSEKIALNAVVFCVKKKNSVFSFPFVKLVVPVPPVCLF